VAFGLVSIVCRRVCVVVVVVIVVCALRCVRAHHLSYGGSSGSGDRIPPRHRITASDSHRPRTRAADR